MKDFIFSANRYSTVQAMNKNIPGESRYADE